MNTHTPSALILFLLLVLSIRSGLAQEIPVIDSMHWTDHPANPLILPPKSTPFHIIGDPTVLNPDESPDGKWHLWANTIPGLHHYVSEDGLQWDKVRGDRSMRKFKWGIRCSILKREGDYYLYFEEVHQFGNRNRIAVTHSKDLYHWSKPVTLLRQDLEWERQSAMIKTLECPGIAYHPIQEKYYLFYSTGLVQLKGTHVKGVREPTHLGLATSSDPFGPFEKRQAPIIAPDSTDQWHTLGSGAMQCYWNEDLQLLIGFNNGIYRRKGENGYVDGSGIMIYTSPDGNEWTLRTSEPILLPDEGGRFKWKDALVYQMGLTEWKGTYYLYYNARSKKGVEYIGLAICPKEDLINYIRE